MEHRQKTFVTLSGFWPSRGWGNLSESVKNENLWQKSFFSENVEWSSNKEKKQKTFWFYLKIFYKNYLQSLKYNLKRTYIFHLILVGIPSRDPRYATENVFHHRWRAEYFRAPLHCSYSALVANSNCKGSNFSIVASLQPATSPNKLCHGYQWFTRQV